MEPRYPALQADSLPAEPPEKPSILHKAYFQELLCGLGVRATCSYRSLAAENCIFKDFLVLTLFPRILLHSLLSLNSLPIESFGFSLYMIILCREEFYFLLSSSYTFHLFIFYCLVALGPQL